MDYKRFEVRKGKSLRVEIMSHWWDEPIDFETSDISPRGLFVKTIFPLHIGEDVVVSFRLDNVEKEFLLFGKISRVEMPRRNSDIGEAGMAISFKDISAWERLLIRESLRYIPPPIPKIIKLNKIKGIGNSAFN